MAKCDKKFVLVMVCAIVLLLTAAGVEVVVVPWFRGKTRHDNDARENAVDVGEAGDASNITGDALGGGRALLRAPEWTGRDGVATRRTSPPEPGRVPSDVFTAGTAFPESVTTPKAPLTPPAHGRDGPVPSGSRRAKRPRDTRYPNNDAKTRA